MLKSNLSESTQFSLTKLKLEYLKSGFKCKDKNSRHFLFITRVLLFSSSDQACALKTAAKSMFLS